MRPDLAQPALSTNGRWLTVDESYTRTLWLTDRKKGSWRGLRETTAGPIYRAAFSANGRYLLFRAAKCAPSRGGFGIGRYDLRSHSIRCAHPSAKLKPVDNFESNDLRISGDGRFAVFLARPPKSTRRDSTSREYLYDFQAATMVEVVPGGSAHASTDGTPGISDDGRLVLVQGSADHSDDALYVRDRQAGTTTRADSFPAPAGYVESFHPSISGDGTAVAYRGRPANGAAGIYVRSPLDGPATRVAAVGTASGSSDGTAETAELSTDGRSLLFSDARGRLQIATR
jgi:Tol biopolymer transport system component